MKNKNGNEGDGRTEGGRVEPTSDTTTYYGKYRTLQGLTSAAERLEKEIEKWVKDKERLEEVGEELGEIRRLVETIMRGEGSVWTVAAAEQAIALRNTKLKEAIRKGNKVIRKGEKLVAEHRNL